MPLRVVLFDKHDTLVACLADNLQDITTRQRPECKVALTVCGLLAHSGLPNLIHNFLERETFFRIGEIVVPRQSRAYRGVRTLGGKNACVGGLFFLVFLLHASERGSQGLSL